MICLLIATPLLDLVVPSSPSANPAEDLEAMADCLNTVHHRTLSTRSTVWPPVARHAALAVRVASRLATSAARVHVYVEHPTPVHGKARQAMERAHVSVCGERT